jgi:hypothetical protein
MNMPEYAHLKRYTLDEVRSVVDQTYKAFATDLM